MQRINKGRPAVNSIVCMTIIMVILGMLSSSRVFAASVKIATIQLKPFGMVENGQNTGFYYDLGNRLAEEAGLTYENRILPYPRIMLELEEGTSDFAFIFPNETLNKIAINVTEIITFEGVVLGKKGVKFNSLQDLHGKHVGKIRGSVVSEAFEADDAIIKVDIRDYDQGVKMLLAGNLDGLIGTEIAIYNTMKQSGIPITELGESLVLNTREAYLFFSKKTANEEVIAALKAAVERLKQGNVIQQIEESYTKSQ